MILLSVTASQPTQVAAQWQDAPTATFVAGTLFVRGTSGDDQIDVRADDEGTVLVEHNGGTVPIRNLFGTATKDNLDVAVVDAGSGDDTVHADESLMVFDSAGELARGCEACVSGPTGCGRSCDCDRLQAKARSCAWSCRSVASAGADEPHEVRV